jgi:hypothetical protein
MNYGPLEFAAYLRRKPEGAEPATVRAARAAAPPPRQVNGLVIVTGARRLPDRPGGNRRPPHRIDQGNDQSSG